MYDCAIYIVSMTVAMNNALISINVLRDIKHSSDL